jgi:hypothetical protein
LGNDAPAQDKIAVRCRCRPRQCRRACRALRAEIALISPVPSGLPCTNSKACEADRKYTCQV